MSCHHLRATEVFAKSINSKKYIGTECKNWIAYKHGWCSGNENVECGEHVNRKSRGIFYVDTTKHKKKSFNPFKFFGWIVCKIIKDLFIDIKILFKYLEYILDSQM